MSGVLCDQLLGYAKVLTIELYFLCGPCRGGGIEYLHRDPASRRRRRKGKSQIGDSKMDPRKTAPCKGQQYIQKTDPSSRQRRRSTKTRP
jgi:hypothetical protein